MINQESYYVLPQRRIPMYKWLLEKYYDWKFEKEFQKKKKELIKLDPFIYDLPNKDENNN